MSANIHQAATLQCTSLLNSKKGLALESKHRLYPSQCQRHKAKRSFRLSRQERGIVQCIGQMDTSTSSGPQNILSELGPAFESVGEAGPPAVALGKFDALHLGHRALAEKAASMGTPYLISFSGMSAVLRKA
eukprot:CAMPEP_0198225572 /NCGR_PEP_ID=MMETSP1445-20131203/101681_1 /TAXON_ID=36898 /ORGANISM="Pyramimonas sp., Strain CCMP2087" /LENGTH=131 /DNA_ID=CAMNT_0043905137 /DNA_START=203 /DNA_END=594 /DNA_ORIENTATION=-